MRTNEDLFEYFPILPDDYRIQIKLYKFNILEIIHFDMATKNPKIILDEHDYIVLRKEVHKTIWMCTKYFASKNNRCKSKLITSGRTVHVSGEHNHPPKLQKNLKNMLSQRVRIFRE
ncbi:hypothetical protein JTB14_000798 [Gonioctena quinquepunctata]|nr:hypothetical protein JTB14_000798 [Gonioctena quinquepunctata]